MIETSNPSPIVWIIEHLSVIGWPALVYAVWRLSRFLTQIEVRAVDAEGHITKMATNCFPTMQESLKTQDGLMKSMDISLKSIAEHQVRRTAASKPPRKRT